MQTTTELAEVVKFRFDANVQASDGEAGRLASVVADAGQRCVLAVGIKLGFLMGATYYIGVENVIAGTEDALSLAIPLDEIKKSPRALPSGALLSGATTITSGGKSLGRLVQVTVTERERALQTIVVDRGVRGESLIQSARVIGVSTKQIQVDLGAMTPDRLTPFRPDRELYDEVYQTLFDFGPLRIDLPGMTIRVVDGAVWLFGHVSSDLNQRLATDMLEELTGVASIHNQLTTDTDLAARVSHALAADARTAGEMIGVYPMLGEVRLRGSVRTAEARAAAGEIVAHTPGAKSVTNDLHVDPNARVVPVMAGVTNEEDIVPGGA
jgi:osmotically-inducible protein OsmY